MSGNGNRTPRSAAGGGRLAGQSVLITGAGSGLGRESALLFAAEGANVVVTDLVPARVDRVVGEVRAAGGQAVGAAADVRVAQDTVDAVALAVNAYGRLDVLMCSAGVPEEGFGTLAFEDISVEGFTSMLATNLTGVFLAAQAAVPVMKKQRRGTILAVSSMAGFVAYPGFPGYTAAKHGVNGLVKGMSLSLGGYGIRANALCPAGSFLRVIAEREEVALRAADLLRADAKWQEQPTLPDEDDLPAFLVSAPAQTSVLAESAPAASTSAKPAVRSHEAAYHRPYLAHAAMGPSSATALARTAPAGANGAHGRNWDGVRLEVWTHSQGVYLLRRELARALQLAEEQVRVRHVEGAGCYGHNGADDVAMDAALLALAVPGRPVQVVWSRSDELGWEPYGPAAVVRIAADVDARGDVLAWQHEIWGNGHVTRPGFASSNRLLAASHRDGGEPIEPAADPPLERGGGAGRNAVPGYAFPAYRVVNHRLSVMPLRTSSLRALGGFANVFAIESFMDELAQAAGRDPVEYRLAQLADPRGRAVIEAVVRRSGWADWSASESSRSAGHGIGYARYKNSSAYCAVVAEVEAVTEVRVRRLTIAVDAGLVINPDGAENQVEGGAMQATSWTLKERVRFNSLTVTSDTWDSYPILRFSEVPAVEVEFLPGNGNPSLGVGETAQGPTAAAIGNALYDALGVRVRTLPLTQEQIIAAMPD